MSTRNVEFEIQDGKLLLEVDLAQTLGLSKSEKNELIASVFPPEPIEFKERPGLKFVMTVICDPPKKVRTRLAK